MWTQFSFVVLGAFSNRCSWWVILFIQVSPMVSKELCSFITYCWFPLAFSQAPLLFPFLLSIACILALPGDWAARPQLIRELAVLSSTISRQSHISHARFLFCCPDLCFCWWTSQILYAWLVMRGMNRSLVISLTSQCIHLFLLKPKWAVGEKGQSPG